MDVWVDTKPIRISLYFVSLIASLLYVLWRNLLVAKAHGKAPKHLVVFIIVGLAGMAVAWREIYMFVLQQAENFPDVINYLKEGEVIVEAYRQVTDSLPGYWWSSQLLMFVLPYVLFINTRARQINMSTMELCAYTWLGFGGAINTSLACFLYRYLVTVSMETRKISKSKMSVWGIAILSVCLWLSYLSIVCLERSVDLGFKVYLFLLHLFLFIPSLLPTLHIEIASLAYSEKDMKGLIPFLYAVLAIFITGHHFYFTHLTLPHDPQPEHFLNLLIEGFKHPSQRGISSDLVFSFVTCSFYLLTRPASFNTGFPIAVPFVLLTPCLSLGSTFSLLMLYEEHVLEDLVQKKVD